MGNRNKGKKIIAVVSLIVVLIGAIFFALKNKPTNITVDLEQYLYFYDQGIEGAATVKVGLDKYLLTISEHTATEQTNIESTFATLEFTLNDTPIQKLMTTNAEAPQPLNLTNGEEVIISISNPEILTNSTISLVETSFPYTINYLGREAVKADLTTKVVNDYFAHYYPVLNATEEVSVQTVLENGTYLKTYYKIEAFDFAQTINYSHINETTFNLTLVKSYQYQNKVYVVGGTGIYVALAESAVAANFYLTDGQNFRDEIIGLTNENRTANDAMQQLKAVGYIELSI